MVGHSDARIGGAVVSIIGWLVAGLLVGASIAITFVLIEDIVLRRRMQR